MLVGSDKIKEAIENEGKNISLKHYTGDTSYDADTQKPSRSSTSSTIRAVLKDISIQEVSFSGGKYKFGDIVLNLKPDVEISVDDEVTIGSDTYSVINVESTGPGDVTILKKAYIRRNE